MTLWPRTLLWRSVLLIALVLVIAHLAWWQIFRASEREPRARQAAQQLVSIVNLTRAALVTAQPSKRYDLLAELSQEEGIQVYPGEPGERIAPLPDRPFLQIIASDLREKLGPDTRLALSRNGVAGLWVSFRIDGEEFWVSLPGSRIERNEPIVWIGLGALVLVLALTGAFLIVARINQPLRELIRATAQMGRGSIPEPVEEAGPAEIRSLARAFNQMASDLRRLDEERALLLAGVSHDLRTPLSRIRLGLEMLEDKGATPIKPDMVQDIEDIDAAISQFLDFARLADSEAVVDGDLNALVRSAVARHERSGRNITMQLAPLPKLALRPAAMQRLVANLVENALRHSGTAVEVRTVVEDRIAALEVLDRGPGIPRDQTETMLQPFTRLESARTGPGTGLGLAIVDRIARMHGGGVRLLPREGGGLCARVELPLDKSAPATTRGRDRT
jgi:two-component system osmolarity sensor histidine kinase EnvZ